jgi:hypothetical protein
MGEYILPLTSNDVLRMTAHRKRVVGVPSAGTTSSMIFVEGK